MVSKVKVLPYQCEVCQKTYSTEKQAEKCEQSHEVTKQKQVLEQANRMKLRDRLVEIRNTAESWEELQEKALLELKSWYGDDFVLEIPNVLRNNWYSYSARCTYCTEKAVKKNDYFSDYSHKGINASNILKTLGFKTGGGSGDGRVYGYQLTYDISDFPCIQEKMLERQRAVEDVKLKIKRSAEDYYSKIKADTKFTNLNKEQEDLEQQIEILQETLQVSVSKKDKYIKDVYRNYYETEANDLINSLPQIFKHEHPDPRPLDYFKSY